MGVLRQEIRVSQDGMSRTCRLAAFALVLAVCLLQGWYEPKRIEAAITQPGAWTQAYSGTANNMTYGYTAAAGSNRIVAVAIYDARAANATVTATVTFGGVALTAGRSDGTVSQRQHTLFYYLPEASIPAGAQNLVVNVGGTVQRLFVIVGTFAGVDQTTPIDASQNSNRNTDGTTAVFASNFTINANCQGILLTNVYNHTGTAAITMATDPPSGFAAASATYGDTTTNSKQFRLNNYATIPTSSVNTTASHGTLTPGTNGFSMTGVSLRQASGIVNPTVTSTTPNSGAQGAANLNVTVTGTGFQSGAAVAFSGTGITVNSATFVSPTSLTANITIAVGATTGARNVTVTNPDQGVGTGTGIFSVSGSSNSAPGLSLGAVAPLSGDTTTTFTYTVVYTDADNDAPAAGNPRLYIGDADGYYSYPTTLDSTAAATLRDGNYANGEQYVFNADFGAAQDLRYYFESRANTGNTTVVTSTPVIGPAVYLMYSQNMVGVPKDLGTGMAYLSVLGNDTGYAWCQTYVSTGLYTGSMVDCTNSTLMPGKAYWVWSTLSNWSLSEPAGVVNIAAASHDIDLLVGWNMISNPYTERIPLQAAAAPRVTVVNVTTSQEVDFATAVANGWVYNTIYEWQGSVAGYVGSVFNGSPPASIDPWKGYWFHVQNTTQTLKLRIYR